MDGSRFDTLAKTLATASPRRQALTAALGGALGILGLRQPEDVGAARSGKCKQTPGVCQICKKGKCSKKNGKKKCKAGKILPKAEGTACTGGSCQGGSCVSPTGQVLPEPTPEPPPGGVTCPPGEEACGDACFSACPSGRVRSPQTCGCCRVSGVVERVCDTAERDPCCSGEACGSIGEVGTACPGRTLGQPCSFGAQCASGFCNPNLVCA
jgi:hypothetical protein